MNYNSIVLHCVMVQSLILEFGLRGAIPNIRDMYISIYRIITCAGIMSTKIYCNTCGRYTCDILTPKCVDCYILPEYKYVDKAPWIKEIDTNNELFLPRCNKCNKHRGLSSVERKRVFDLLVKSEPVFPHKNEIGKTKVLQHQIHTGEAQRV